MGAHCGGISGVRQRKSTILLDRGLDSNLSVNNRALAVGADFILRTFSTSLDPVSTLASLLSSITALNVDPVF